MSSVLTLRKVRGEHETFDIAKRACVSCKLCYRQGMRYFAIIVCGMLSIGCDAGGLIIVEQVGDSGIDISDGGVDAFDAEVVAPLPTGTASTQAP